MIVVRLELWPHGFEERKRSLGIATLVNDATGDDDTGNYEVHFGKAPGLSRAAVDDPHRLRSVKSAVWRTASVRGFRRQQRGAWDLLYLALKDACEGRNG